MHTVIMIVAGILLLAVFAAIGRLWGGSMGLGIAGKLFILVWLIVSVINAWVGVNAGHGILTELVINVFVFIVPALAAVWLWRQFN